MKYAVIKTGGKQYKVTEGKILEVEQLKDLPKSQITFSDVLLYVSEDRKDLLIGTPFVSSITVKAQVLEKLRGPKIRVSKFKSKARYRRTTGHRQALSKIRIDQIGEKKAEKAGETKEVPKKRAVRKKKA